MHVESNPHECHEREEQSPLDRGEGHDRTSGDVDTTRDEYSGKQVDDGRYRRHDDAHDREEALTTHGLPDLQRHLTARGIKTAIHYPVPLHRQPSLSGLGYATDQFPVANRLAAEILSLPIYPGLSDDQIDGVLTLL
ncbi:MAG TPA: hypothetical protein EYQ02_01350 [Microbacterium sp.]|nr:hypothetical protein [Microbacterium sp.]